MRLSEDIICASGLNRGKVYGVKFMVDLLIDLGAFALLAWGMWDLFKKLTERTRRRLSKFRG